MIYLVVMFLVAGTGLAALWLQQRRERAHLGSVDGFKDSLERLSAAPAVRPRRRPAPARAAAPAARRSPGRTPHASRRSAMDPARRAAARKRIEARRSAVATRARVR